MDCTTFEYLPTIYRATYLFLDVLSDKEEIVKQTGINIY